MKLIIFGTGIAAHQILKYPLKTGNHITLVCDNDKAKEGSTILGYEISLPDKILQTKYDRIIIAMWNGWGLNEILDQLLNMGVLRENIVFSYDPIISRYAETELDQFFNIPKVDCDVKFQKNHVTLRPECKGETSKSHDRRLREGFFEKYCKGEGLDIGCGSDPVVPGVSGWDILNGDAQYLKGIEDESFDFVYSSHCLEHMRDVRISLRNWFRVVKPGGYLIVTIPDRDLYEKKKELPSRWNGDHKHYFLLGISEHPDTLDIIQEINESILGYKLIYAKRCDYGHTITDPMCPSDGEYQIEIVVQKVKS